MTVTIDFSFCGRYFHLCTARDSIKNVYVHLNYLIQEKLHMKFHHGKLKVIQATSDLRTRLRTRDVLRKTFRQGFEKQWERENEIFKGSFFQLKMNRI